VKGVWEEAGVAGGVEVWEVCLTSKRSRAHYPSIHHIPHTTMPVSLYHLAQDLDERATLSEGDTGMSLNPLNLEVPIHQQCYRRLTSFCKYLRYPTTQPVSGLAEAGQELEEPTLRGFQLHRVADGDMVLMGTSQC
jgi:hypothetical protein